MPLFYRLIRPLAIIAAIIVSLPITHFTSAQNAADPSWIVPYKLCTTTLYDCNLVIQFDLDNRLFAMNVETHHLYIFESGNSAYQEYDLSRYPDTDFLMFYFLPFKDYIVFTNGLGQVYRYLLSTRQLSYLSQDSFRTCNHNNQLFENYPPMGRLGVHGKIMLCQSYILSVDSVTGESEELFEDIHYINGIQRPLMWQRLIAGRDGAIYRQGTRINIGEPKVKNGTATVMRRYPYEILWTKIEIPVDEILSFEKDLTQFDRLADLIDVDQNSNLYMDISLRDKKTGQWHLQYVKLYRQGKLIKLITQNMLPPNMVLTGDIVNGNFVVSIKTNDGFLIRPLNTNDEPVGR